MVWESHIWLKGLGLGTGSGKDRMSILVTSLLTTHIMDYLNNSVSMWNVPNVKGQQHKIHKIDIFTIL